jgi:hypothetical protein
MIFVSYGLKPGLSIKEEYRLEVVPEQDTQENNHSGPF